MAHCCQKNTNIESKIGKLELLMKKEKLFRISMYDKADLSRDYFCGFKPLDFPVSNSLEGQFDTNCKKLKKRKIKILGLIDV